VLVPLDWPKVGDWYWIGLCVGIGLGCGIAAAGLAARARAGVFLAALAGAGLGVAAGFGIDNWDEAVGGAAGGLIGAFGVAELVRGTLRRGGTAGATALLVGAGGLLAAALALVPGVGYAEAAVLPLLAARLRRRAGERHAGLRILARD
jgi:hypothetical protein